MKERIVIYLPNGLKDKLKIAADNKGMSASEFVRYLFRKESMGNLINKKLDKILEVLK